MDTDFEKKGREINKMLKVLFKEILSYMFQKK